MVGCVAGIGFTMALFVAQLAFAESSALPAAKLAVLIGSGLAATLALVVGRMTLPVLDADISAEDAEQSNEA